MCDWRLGLDHRRWAIAARHSWTRRRRRRCQIATSFVDFPNTRGRSAAKSLRPADTHLGATLVSATNGKTSLHFRTQEPSADDV